MSFVSRVVLLSHIGRLFDFLEVRTVKSETDMRFCAGRQAKSIQIRFIKTAIVCILLCSITPLYAVTPWLHVEGNKIKDPESNIVVLRGVALIDLGATELWRGGAIEMIDRLTDPTDDQGSYTGWGTKVVRLAIYPTDGDFTGGPWYFEDDPESYYNDLLRPVVDYCKMKDLYVIIDWHYVGVNTSAKVSSTNAFWTYIAPRFAGDSHVLFELFNEPLNTGPSGDAAKWESCRVDMQNWTNIVRSYAPNNLILVGCPQWSQIIAPTATNPVTGGNIVYVSHIYPDHWAGQTYVNQILTAVAVHPVMITEWGFIQGGAVPTNGTLSGYGQPFHEFREAHGIGHTAWCADYEWGPPMFNSGWTLRCGENYMGCFTKDILYEMKDANQPGGGDTTPPDAPTGLAAAAGDSVVWLTWIGNSEGDLAGYNVYRSTTSGGSYSRLNGSLLSDPNYTDNDAGGGLTYYYVVTAVDTSLNESNNSNEVFATPTDTTPPLAPTGLSATAGDRTVSLNWNDNSEADLDGYNVYRSMTSGSGYVQINGSLLSSSDYTDNSVTNGTTYYYVVTAVDILSNESNGSNEVSETPELRTDVEIIGSWVAGTSHTKESGTNRALIFIAHAERNGTISLSSVTYGGKTMTKVIDKVVSSGSPAYYAYVAAFILNEADVNAVSSGTFVPTWSGTPDSGQVAYGSVFLQNVDQTVLVGATASNGTTSGNNITTDALTTNDGDMVIDAATCGSGGTGDLYTVNNGFTEALEHDMTSCTGVDGYKSATGANETPSVTHDNANRQVLIGFVVKAGAGEWLYGDLTYDNKVDMNDLYEFSLVWLVEDCENNNILELDLDDDCVINFYEYSFFAQNWLEEI
jgi:fibronectin type 3 domain-containing protein